MSPSLPYYIVNTFDRPYERLIAKLVNGKLFYVHPDLANKDWCSGMDDSEAVPVESFGIDLKEENGFLVGKKARESEAKYPGGKTRPWQGLEWFQFGLPVKDNQQDFLEVALAWIEQESIPNDSPVRKIIQSQIREPWESYTEVAARILAKEVRRLQKVKPKWFPIETAPKDGTRVLLACSRYLNELSCDIGYWDAAYYLIKEDEYGGAWASDYVDSEGNCVELFPSFWTSLPSTDAI